MRLQPILYWITLRRLAAIVIMLLAIPLFVSACNTTEGVGEDISAAGDAIDNAAENANGD